MSTYTYTGLTPTGEEVSGELQAGNRGEVARILRNKRLRPSRIQGGSLDLSLSFSSRVKLADLTRFTRQLAAMTSAGLPLVQCVETLGKQSQNTNLADVARQVSADLQAGIPLAVALEKHPLAFNTLYCSMVAAGEASGDLGTVLTRLAEYQEDMSSLLRKIRGAMTYPVVLAVVSVAVVALLLAYVVPQFSSMFAQLGEQLPTATRVVVATSSLAQRYLPAAIAGVLLVIVGLRWYGRTESGAFLFDTLKLKTPLLGDLVTKSAVSRFSLTLSTLLTSGVKLLDALRTTARTAGNKVLEKALLGALDRISHGESIAQPLGETKLFPPMVTDMIAVGEKTGDLPGMLEKVAAFYKEEVDSAVEGLTSVLEPVMLVCMGAVIGLVLYALYLPMFDMINAVN